MVRVESPSGVRQLAPASVQLSEREQAPALQSVEERAIWRPLGGFRAVVQPSNDLSRRFFWWPSKWVPLRVTPEK
jgi:hypothetical protein